MPLLSTSIQIAILFAWVKAQAPGDGTAICQMAPFIKTPFSSNIVPLMDSYDYVQLLPQGTWSSLDVDGDGYTWAETGDKACRQVVGSCFYNLDGNQNNWFVTQHIDTTVNGVALSQVVVKVNFSLYGCPTGGSCQQSFQLQIYETPNINSNSSLITANYVSFSRVAVGSNPTGNIVETTDVLVPLRGSGGMYLAAQDTGTCVSITHLTVFYYVCPQQVLGFISYPQTVASNGLITQLMCALGASVVSQQPQASCANLGVWGPPSGSCSCSPGYTNISQTCQSCPPGTYKSVQGSSVCLPCPSNSNSSVNGSTQCACLQGYFRAAGSGPDIGCIVAQALAIGVPVSIVAMAVLIFIIIIISVAVLRKTKQRASRRTKDANAAIKMSATHIYSHGTTDGLVKTKIYIGEYCTKHFEDILVSFDQLQMDEQPCGSGEFGVVYHATLTTKDGPTQEVAIKSTKNTCSEDIIKAFLEECASMKSFKHPNVLGLVGMCLNSPNGVPLMVLPFMANGNLKKYLQLARRYEKIDQYPKGLPCNILISMCLDIAKGMSYLADKRIVHRDLAARNCLVDIDLVIKVGDFGLSRDIYMDNYYRMAKTNKCPVKWMPPEMIRDGISTEKSDVWAYGVTCWEVFSIGTTPYPGVENFEMLGHLEKGLRLQQPHLCPDAIFKWMKSCWIADPQTRPTFMQLVSELVLLTSSIKGIAEQL